MPYKTWHLLKSNQRDVRVRFYPIMWKMMSIRHAFISPSFPWWCHRQSTERKKISLHLFKHKSVHRRWARGDIIMKIICSYQKSGTRKAAGKEWSFKSSKHKQDSRGVTFLGSELIADLLDIKAGCCDGSALTYGFTAHTPHNAAQGKVWREQACCTQTHMWKTLKLLMGGQTWQKPSWIMVLS